MSMLKYYNYDIVFREIPNHVILAINITNCPNRCVGCHSPHLQRDVGELLDEKRVFALLERYASAITCLCFMGGDHAPHCVAQLAQSVRCLYPGLKTAWYSGCGTLPTGFNKQAFHYIKLGGYVEQLGSLDSPSSNQQLFKIKQDGTMEDVSHLFRIHGV